MKNHAVPFAILSAFLTVVCHADTAVGDDPFFDFIRSDMKTPVAPPPVKTPTEAEAMLDKWKQYEQSRTEKEKTDRSAARKILMEMLLKKSVAATPELRGNLLAEIERIKAANVDELLLNQGRASQTMFAGILGVWLIKQTGSTQEFTPNGVNIIQGYKPHQWTWIEPEAGVIMGQGEKHGNLFWLEKPNSISGINGDYYRFNMTKKVGAKMPQSDPAVINLSTAELLQRQTLEKELAMQRQRVIKWLLDKAKLMSPDEMAQVVTKVHELEVEAEELDDSPSKLKGRWTWENQEITFQPMGIIANRAGQKIGRWAWLMQNKSRFIAVFNGAKATGNDMFVVKTPKDDLQTSVDAHRLSSGHITVTRKLP